MVTKWINSIYQKECYLFFLINSRFDHEKLNAFFRFITHFGGARMTISISLLIILISDEPIQLWGIQSAATLAFSHLLVAFIKKMYP